MLKLNRDILFLIFEEIKDDKKDLYSFLTVNKTWCEIIIPILWKDPWKYSKWEKDRILFNVIISHLSEESKNDLKIQGIDFTSISSYQKPLFNYISFCRSLNLNAIDRIINTIIYNFSKSNITIIKNEIYNLFFNENTRFTHLYISQQFDYQIQNIPGSKRCISEIKFLSCNTSIKDHVLDGLTRMCKSIKELELFIDLENNNYGIVKLIESQKKLLNIHFLTNYSKSDETFCKILENSLIKHSNTLQYFKIAKQPTTNILSFFMNLKILELDDDCGNFKNTLWLENLSLPYLQILRASRVPIKALSTIIENTSGYLIEIKIDFISHDEISNKKLIQVIHQNCPKLEYLKLVFRSCNIPELENLLINCQNLIELSFIISDLYTFNWDNLFKILTKSSPNRLFMFEFDFYEAPKLKTLKSFFDNWKGRNPMLLKLSRINNELSDLIEKYKSKGIVKQQYSNDSNDSLDKNDTSILNYNLPIENYDFTDSIFFV
ncbi:hypothetical protein RclHR1_00060002 [Rhizophagus clarus]|uniref:F-box domain-containing protein n=1 Tax=Rhizophagus clarus TaxID=94130 RepID=A0A2Z6SHI0_9GLOM|nr:hypothetical protein RclHR1_00060002 [Rhizophagus clarus]GES74596.1 hypothetical protein GLOIN_2v1765864 [Rhizophagus clarus]